jgi:hypothetical protein
LTPGVVGEDRGGGSNLGAHVADGAHAGAGDRVDAFAVVLNNGTEKMNQVLTRLFRFKYTCPSQQFLHENLRASRELPSMLYLVTA